MSTISYLNNMEFKRAVASIDEKVDLQHDSRMVMYRFLSEVERMSDEKGYSRKLLAQLIGTSASYITQLFRGNKTINIETIAKFQRVFDVTFEVKAVPNKVEEVLNEAYVENVCENTSIPQGFWAYHKFNPSYGEVQHQIVPNRSKEKSIA